MTHVDECRTGSSPVIGHSTDDGVAANVEAGFGRRSRMVRAVRATKEVAMALFMDVHSGFFGVSAEQLSEAHGRDLAIEADEGVHFERAWLDPDAGKVFCLATGPSRESVLRIHERAGHPTPEIYELSIEV
jgi:hypothetical protein